MLLVRDNLCCKSLQQELYLQIANNLGSCCSNALPGLKPVQIDTVITTSAVLSEVSVGASSVAVSDGDVSGLKDVCANADTDACGVISGVIELEIAGLPLADDVADTDTLPAALLEEEGRVVALRDGAADADTLAL